MSATYQEIKRAVEIISEKSQEGANYNVYEASNKTAQALIYNGL
jgi:hypothetical protein